MIAGGVLEGRYWENGAWSVDEHEESMCGVNMAGHLGREVGLVLAGTTLPIRKA